MIVSKNSQMDVTKGTGGQQDERISNTTSI